LQGVKFGEVVGRENLFSNSTRHGFDRALVIGCAVKKAKYAIDDVNFGNTSLSKLAYHIPTEI
jgi:hypothetical protein